MKKTIHRYYCASCSTVKDGNQEETPIGWMKMTPARTKAGETHEDFFVCTTCLVGQDVSTILISSGRDLPRNYIPYKEIQVISCDGDECQRCTEVVIKPGWLLTLDSIPWGAWVTCTRGLPVPAERHFCVECSRRLGLFKSQKPVEERPKVDIGGGKQSPAELTVFGELP